MSSLWNRVSPIRGDYLHTIDQQAPAQRVEAWRELMLHRSMDVVGKLDADTLHGAIHGQVFDGGALAHWSLSPGVVTRTSKMANRLDDEYVFISMILEGSGGIEQNGETFDLQPGDFVVVDGTRPLVAHATSGLCTRGFFHLHKSALRRRLGKQDELAFGVFKQGQRPLQQLASSFLRDLTGLVGQVDGTTLRVLGEQSLDIIALLANDRRHGAIDPSTHQSAMLLRLKLHMKAHLGDATYSIEMAAPHSA